MFAGILKVNWETLDFCIEFVVKAQRCHFGVTIDTLNTKLSLYFWLRRNNCLLTLAGWFDYVKANEIDQRVVSIMSKLKKKHRVVSMVQRLFLANLLFLCLRYSLRCFVLEISFRTYQTAWTRFKNTDRLSCSLRHAAPLEASFSKFR